VRIRHDRFPFFAVRDTTPYKKSRPLLGGLTVEKMHAFQGADSKRDRLRGRPRIRIIMPVLLEVVDVICTCRY